ncbi:PAS domain-containing protein [Sporosarcina sp. FSL W7-1349]|uniref:helix-turn-helix transcriptional regulator n=1 Tax=Sporosarcina sp. FSL W7-1349 TaxID=2921561 RepID=UPI0030FD0B82
MANKESAEILKRYQPVADMIAATFGRNCEVVIHDFTDTHSSLVYIAGSVTERALGAPTTEVILKELRQHGDAVPDLLGLTSRTRDGKFVKTSSSFIRNESGKVIGLIGINFDITAFSLVNQIIKDFSTTPDLDQLDSPMEESYAKNIDEVFDQLINSSLKEIGIPISKMSREGKIQFVRSLEEKGTFLIQGSIEKIANALNVSKQTIYNYLE